MKQYILTASAFVLVETALPRMTFADATANVTNLINRLDPLTTNVLSNFVKHPLIDGWDNESSRAV